MYVDLSDENVSRARRVIQDGINAGRNGTDTDLTSLGILGEILRVLSKNDD